MFMVNKELHSKWNRAEMTYKYMKGHTDSVYCVQFDEYVYLTYRASRKLTVGTARRLSRVQGIGQSGFGTSRPVNAPRF
jgi:F-box and WD-40 domain protein 1/11